VSAVTTHRRDSTLVRSQSTANVLVTDAEAQQITETVTETRCHRRIVGVNNSVLCTSNNQSW
jgi:hypothetical protein